MKKSYWALPVDFVPPSRRQIAAKQAKLEGKNWKALRYEEKREYEDKQTGHALMEICATLNCGYCAILKEAKILVKTVDDEGQEALDLGGESGGDSDKTTDEKLPQADASPEPEAPKV